MSPWHLLRVIEILTVDDHSLSAATGVQDSIDTTRARLNFDAYCNTDYLRPSGHHVPTEKPRGITLAASKKLQMREAQGPRSAGVPCGTSERRGTQATKQMDF